MKKFILLLMLVFFAALFPGFSSASDAFDELRAGPERAWTCGQTVSDSRIFSDEPSRLLFFINAGGNVGADDIAFFYKDGSQINMASRCSGVNSPSDISCSTACAGTTPITWNTYFQDSGANSPDSVTMSGTAYETYQPTELITEVGFNGWLISVFWDDCSAGQRVDNGSCVPITGSITPDKTLCAAPCDVNLTWDTNSYQTATITKNGNTLTTVTTTGGVSSTYTSGGPILDSELTAGTYNYCIKGNYAHSPDNQPVAMDGDLDCKTVTVTTPLPPTLGVSLIADPSSGTAPLDDVDLTADVFGTAAGDIRYRFDCTNDGIFEKDVTNLSDPYTAADLCNYSSAGTYTARVRVDRQGVPADATTTITVSTAPQPNISLNGPFTFNAVVGTNPDNQTLVISNTGTATLNWTGTRTAAATWLTLETTSGSVAVNSSQNVTLSVTSNLFAVGTYTATITVTDPNASNSPQTVNVTLNVTAAPVPTVSLLINGVTSKSFNFNDSFNLAMSTSPSVGSGRPIQLCSTFIPGAGSTGTAHSNQCTGFDYTTNSSGGYNWTGTFNSTDVIGTWTEWVNVRTTGGDVRSNDVDFAVAAPAPVPTIGASLVLSPNPMNLNTASIPTGNFNLTFSGVAAGISANGSKGTITVGIGTNINYVWSSYNASSGKATLQIKDTSGNNVSQDPCGNQSGPWSPVSGTSGSISGPIADCQAGYTYVITYIAENTALQSNSSNVTIIVSLPTVSLSINKSSFNFNDSFNLAMSTSPSVGSGRPIQLCSTFIPGAGSTGTAHSNQCTGFDYTTNSSGGYNWTGTFNSTDVIGTWTEWVNVQLIGGQTVRTNNVNFTVRAPVSALPLNKFFAGAKNLRELSSDFFSMLVKVARAEFMGSTITLCSGGGCPQKPAGGTINWTSSNSLIASVNQNGSVTAVSGGTATVTAIFDPDGTGPITPMSAAAAVNVTSPPPNSPPSASSVTVTEPDYCVSGPAATINWTYSDPEGNSQSAYQVQVDDQSSFNSPEVDSGKVSGSGTSYFASSLSFNKTLKARVRVWDSQDAVSNWTQSSSWKTPKHAYPFVNFTWSPLNPSINQFVQFTDQTQFFNDDSGTGQRAWSWLFGDGGSSNIQNPNYTYLNFGLFNVTETVTDKDNYICALTKPIGIERPIPVWIEVGPK